MKPSFFAARSLFFTIFLWFFAAQLLIGAALYALAAATERRFDQNTWEMAGGYIEARAKAAAVAFEIGGQSAAREAWQLPPSSGDGNARGDDGRGDPGGDDGGGDPGGGDGPPDGGPEDRNSSALYQVNDAVPRLLVGQTPALTPAQLASAARSASDSTLGGSDGTSWLARRVRTGKGTYLALIRLREHGGPHGPGGPGEIWSGLWGGRPGPDGPWWNGALRWCVIALTMAAFCFVLARYLTAPALLVSRAARQFAAGDYAVRVGPQLGARRDELSDLGRDFDFMAQRIEDQRAAERRLLGDISHELRSPLARLQVALDLAESGADAATRGYLVRIEEEVEELGALIGQLLTLTRLENAGQDAIRHEEIDLSQLVAHVCADADFEASAANRSVELRENQPALVCGDASLLRSAIENVVRNALNHAPQSSKIEVTLETTATEAIVRVRDWGPGVPDDALEALFQPFYRVATARDRQSGGTGLGLSITQRALASHGGDVRASNADGGGLEVEMRLPLA